MRHETMSESVPLNAMPAKQPTGADIIAKSLAAAGATHAFGIPGGEVLALVDALERAGVTILQGVCFYILQRLSGIREENGWTNLISNSGKLVNTITAHRFNTVLRRTRDCVDIACTGRLA